MKVQDCEICRIVLVSTGIIFGVYGDRLARDEKSSAIVSLAIALGYSNT
ncbi:hypothetical protein H6F71_08480 [Microcoleus sp. FACHB-61]|nr:hypothetical protein [Microcoleus sp. FACHB-61]